MTQVHLTSKDYNTLLRILDKSSMYRSIVLDCGIAGMIHYTKIDNIFYYEDYFYSNNETININYLNPNDDSLHAEVYQKLALTNLYYM